MSEPTGMTNAQVALIAGATGAGWDSTRVLQRAERFLAWLEEKDEPKELGS